MKFSLSNNQTPAYLNKADEIYIKYKDRRAIPDYAEKYSAATLTLEIPPQTEWDFNEIKEYSILSKGKLKICIPEIRDERVAMLRNENIPFFWGYPISNGYELESMRAMGVCEVRVTAPLFFYGDLLRECGVPIRVTANVAHEGYIPGMNGIIGSWIRPEDVEVYEGIVDIIEFADCDMKKEQALYRIYAEQKNWPGRVDILITNISTTAYNRMIPPTFAESRINCRQRCVHGGSCRICERLLYLADKERIQAYIDSVENDEAISLT